MDKRQIAKPVHGSLEWLHTRHRNAQGKCIVGASEVATVMGCNPYENIGDLAVRKLLDPVVSAPNEAMTRGNLLEPSIVAYATLELGIELICPDVMYAHNRIISTLDARGTGANESIVVEAKSNNHWALASELPQSWYWQAQAQMFCTGVDEITFAILDRHQRFGLDYVQRDNAMIEMMQDHVGLFCEAIDHEELPDEVMLTAPQVQLLFPKAEGEIALDNNALALINEWGALKEALKDLEGKEKAIKDELADMMRGNEFATIDGYRVLSYKAQSAKRFDSKALLLAQPHLEKEYTTTSTFRVMRTMK